MTADFGSTIPESQALARATRQRNRFFTLTAIAALLTCLCATATRPIGAQLAAGETYTWSDGTIFIHSETIGSTCEVTTSGTVTPVFVARDTSSWAAISGSDITANEKSGMTCANDITITSGIARILTYPARYAWTLALAAALLFISLLMAIIRTSVLQQAQPWRRKD